VKVRASQIKPGDQVLLHGETWATVATIKRTTSFDGQRRRRIIRLIFDRVYHYTGGSGSGVHTGLSTNLEVRAEAEKETA